MYTFGFICGLAAAVAGLLIWEALNLEKGE